MAQFAHGICVWHAYQQLRQTSITEELLDILTGFEALTSGESQGDRQRTVS